MKAFVGMIFLLLAVVVMVFNSGDRDRKNLDKLRARQGFGPSQPSADYTAPPERPTTTRQDLTLDFTWSKEGFDNIMEANFTIKNDGPYAIKDIEITCDHSAPSGTVIDRNTRTIYEIVKAKSKRLFTKFNMGFINSQVKSSSCRIVDFKVVE